MPRTNIFKPSDWLDMRDCAYEFGTLAHISGRNEIPFPFGVPYLLDIIDNIKKIGKGG
jgi:hypothetical protein